MSYHWLAQTGLKRIRHNLGTQKASHYDEVTKNRKSFLHKIVVGSARLCITRNDLLCFFLRFWVNHQIVGCKTSLRVPVFKTWYGWIILKHYNCRSHDIYQTLNTVTTHRNDIIFGTLTNRISVPAIRISKIILKSKWSEMNKGNRLVIRRLCAGLIDKKLK